MFLTPVEPFGYVRYPTYRGIEVPDRAFVERVLEVRDPYYPRYENRIIVANPEYQPGGGG